MSNFKKIISAVLCAASVISLTACEEEIPSNASSGGANPATTPATTTTTNTLDDDLNNPVDISNFVEDGQVLTNPNLVYFGHYDMRVAGDIKPGVKLFEETYGGHIDYEQVVWGERITKLQAKIAADDSPDLFDKEDGTFPGLMSKNVFEDLTSYIDLSQPQWEGMDTLVEKYSWGGKHYYYPFTVNALPYCLIYSRTMFDKYDITDPKELYDKNEWTWDTFKSTMMTFVEKNPDALGGVYGLVGLQMISTTGTPFVGVEDGVIKNNMNTPEVERAASFLEELRREKLAVRGEGMWSNETPPLKNGQTAFLGVGQWKITDYCKQTMKYGDEFFFVPFPRDPKADDYYYGSSNFGYMVPKGAKNVEGAAVFINVMRKCNTDPELLKVVKESIMNDKKYSEEQYDFLHSFEDVTKFNMVVESCGGFDEETSNQIETYMVNLAFEQGEEQKSWAQIREEYTPVLDNTISEYQS